MVKLVATTRRLAAVLQFTFLLTMTVLSITKSLIPADSLLFFPSKLQIPDSPQFVPVWTDFEVLNNNPLPKTFQMRHSHCSWISVVISTTDIDAYGTLVATVVTSPFMREGPHQCVIELLAGNASYSYTVDWTVLSNQYDIRPHELIGSKSDILLEPSRFYSQIPLKNPFAEPLLIHEATAESDYINVFIGSESKATRVNSSSVLKYSISKPRAKPGVYHEYIAVQTSFDRVVIPITVYQTEENLRFVERELDFGTLHTRGERKRRQIVVEYSGMDDIIIKNIYVRHSSPFTTVKVFEPALPIEGNRTVVGSITFQALASGKFEGSILVETQSSFGEIVKELPFKAEVRFENHIVSPNLAVLRLRPFQRGGGGGDHIRLSFQRGQYVVPLSDDSFVIEEAQLVTCQNVLAIDHHMREGRSVLVVHVLRDIEEEDIKAGLRTCWVEVASNASFHKVPLHLSTGRVELDALQGKLVDHETRLSISGETFRDLYVADIGHISQFEPRDEKIAISNYNPADEVVTAFVADMDACLCLLAYVPVGFNSLSRVSAEMRALAVEDFVKVQPMRSSRCVCTGRPNSPWGMEIRAGYHSIFAIVPDRMRPTPLTSTQYINSSHVAVKTSAVRIRTDHQEISLAMRYRPFSRTVGFDCVSAPFCSTFPLGMRHVNIRVAVPTADHANARLLFDSLTSATTLNAAFKWADSKQSVFDCRLSVATPHWQTSVLFARSVWYAALMLIENANVDARALVDRLVSIEDSCVAADGGVDYARLFTELEDFKSRISVWFSDGFTFKPTGILVSSQELSKSFTIEAPVAVLPHQILPDGYDVDLLVGGNRISHLYVEYFNPFEVEVSVAIVSNHSVGAVKRTAEESSGAMDEGLSRGRKIPVRYRIGRTSPTEVLLAGAVVLDTLDGSRTASPFLKVDGDQTNAAIHQAGNLVRFPQQSWLVPPRKKMFIGPIEISGSGKESSTSFSALVFNSFSGFDELSVHINNSPSKFVVRSIAACEQDSNCLPVSASPPSSANESVVVRFKRSALPRRYEVVLQNVGPPFLVNNLLWGGISCFAGAANRHLYIDQVFRRTGFVSLCGQLPVEVPHNATLQLDLPLPELAIFESIPLLLTLQEQASPLQVASISSFSVGFAFASDISPLSSAAFDAVLVAAACIVGFIGIVSAIASVGIAIDANRIYPLSSGLQVSLDALTAKNAQQRAISPMAITKTEAPAAEEACVALRSASTLDEDLRAQTETLLAKWKVTRESSNRTNLHVVPSEQHIQAVPEVKPSLATADAPAKPVQVLHNDRSDRSTVENSRQKAMASLRSSSPKSEPMDSISAPPGLPPHPQFQVDLVGNVDDTLSSFVDGADFDDSPLFRYQGQLLGLEDESADFLFEDGVVGESSALENKFLQSISSVHQDGGILSSLSSLRFTVNLDLESELDLTGNLDLLRSTEGARSIFDDLTDSDSFYPSMPLGSILSFLNEPSSSTNDPTGSIFGRRPSPGAAENFRWFGANQVETPDRSFFGPNEFFSFAEGADLEEELEK